MYLSITQYIFSSALIFTSASHCICFGLWVLL